MGPTNQLDRIVAYFVRHGSTILNGAGKFRGWLDVPLDANGKEDAKKIAEFFQNIALGDAFTSSLERAIQTSQIVLEPKGMYATPSDELRPISVGELEGKDKASHRKIVEYFQKHPNEKFPGGESINGFRARVRRPILGGIKSGVENELPSITFGHSSIIHEVGNLVHHDHNKALVEPGGVVAVSFDGKSFSAEAIFKPKTHGEGYVA
jgi:broad specificity phosphatase PhoE